MNASENLSDLREEMRKAEREASLREAKARILAETIGVQREELERVISIAHATQSRTLGYDIKADEIAESSLKIEQGKLQLEQANTQAEEAREHLRKVRSKVQEVGKKEDSKRRVQEAWEELAVLVQRFEGTESFADGNREKDWYAFMSLCGLAISGEDIPPSMATVFRELIETIELLSEREIHALNNAVRKLNGSLEEERVFSLVEEKIRQARSKPTSCNIPQSRSDK